MELHVYLSWMNEQLIPKPAGNCLGNLICQHTKYCMHAVLNFTNLHCNVFKFLYVSLVSYGCWYGGGGYMGEIARQTESSVFKSVLKLSEDTLIIVYSTVYQLTQCL